jgi:hypothetical protein
MASRMIHLAISNLIEQKVIVKNTNRFKIGHILPDAIIRGNEAHAASHFKINVCEYGKKMIDFNEFRNRYAENMQQDDLYLGYYLHLIEDAVYRKFMYYDYKLGNIGAENVEILHNDYRLLNSYLISKYRLNDEITIPSQFNNERVTEIYPFILVDFIKRMENDFVSYANGTTVYLTETMVDEFIEQCVCICLNELQAISENTSIVNPLDYAWDRA